MRKRTTMDLDRELVREAAAVLGTSRIVETVQRMRAPRFDISEGDGSRTLGS